MPQPIEIAICGGGIGGLSLAIGLLNHPNPNSNIKIRIYEAAPAFAEIGAGVAFGPNALRAMSLIDPKVREGYDRRRTENASAEKKEAWFDFRWGMDVRNGGKAGEWFHTTYARPSGQSSIHRAHFLDELVSLVPDECASFGKCVESLTQLEDGRMQMNFKDGSKAEADAVIGCDGIKSQVRPMLLGQDSPAAHATFTRKYAYRGLIPMEKAVGLLGDELARNSQMYFGYHGHVLTFPIEHGKTMNVVAFKTSQSRRWEDERWVLPMQRKDMENDYADWGENVKSILSLMEKPDVWALFDHPPAETYYKGRVCLMGDSAHASTPHNGAGAGMALEDAYILSSLLGQVHRVDEIEHAFDVFDVTRRERSQRLVTASRDAGETYDLENKEIGDNLEKLKHNLDNRYRWVWEHNLEDDMARAMALMANMNHKKL